MKYLVCLTLLVLCSIAGAQSKKNKSPITSDTSWYEGAIIKGDGKVKGRIRFNDQLGVVNFSDVDKEQYTYSASRISGFEFFDDAKGKWRYFFSIENFSESQKSLVWNFHELIMEFERFSVWSKVEPIHIKIEQVGGGGIPNGTGGVTPTLPSTVSAANQTKVIYLMDPDSNHLYWLLKLEDNESVKQIPDISSSDKRGKVNLDILEKYLGAQNFARLREYAKENNLNWKRESDLMLILNYCHQL